MMLDGNSVLVFYERDGRFHTHKMRKADVDRFGNAAVALCLNGRMDGREEFALGFAAGIDAMASGNLDLSDVPGMLDRAYADMHDVTDRKRDVTDAMVRACAAYGAA